MLFLFCSKFVLQKIRPIYQLKCLTINLRETSSLPFNRILSNLKKLFDTKSCTVFYKTLFMKNKNL